ncbi:hypothetical protein [Sphingomonas sp. RS2018]
MKALVLALAAGALASAALAVPIRAALADLTRERAAVAGLGAPPSPVVARDDAVAARSQPRASDALAARLRTAAAGGGVLIERAAPVAGPGAARVRLRASGSQDAVVAFVDTVERARPLARFTRWSVRGEGSGVRLTAEVVAPWR